MSRGLSDLPVLVVANKTDLLTFPDTSERGKLRLDITNKVSPVQAARVRVLLQVKKSWKLNHVEVSAKYNWNITGLFRELSSQLVRVQSRLAAPHTNNNDSNHCCLVF